MEQKSFQNEEEGCLYLIPTPIGNLEDLTFRALRLLKEVHVVAAEDTRQTRKLFNHFEIATPLVSYHEHNKRTSGEKLIERMKSGEKVGLVTDAGTPGISDPGQDLVQLCVEESVPVIPLPGACAATTALIASGLSTDHFLFYGFLPRQKKDRQKALEELQNQPYTLIFYEAPHRLKETISAMASTFGSRPVALARELTKRYESFVRGAFADLHDWLRTHEVKGECCIIVEGNQAPIVEEEQPFWEEMSALDHIKFYIKKGMDKKDAIKMTAADRGLPKREVYNLYHQED
ncbi:16S rRNA (cytidine(1402)-2'-O)-methyltransferase [Pullulanibacillus sp. KACC 23026]|uniref:16S rRNA (cytidine(1402)-2'-O)-methyltransferase n=1 Tax=Pullulanibacillus sp. KACC 23026 TaxID=3028315 RepID=UPI0023B1F638|nr:16S rRNA (cytidine(1402)-2'-O)-methyltransferase [Pullulanibacillus sp. KACC 23026]WEG12746.1 16S rRNA (cytidine(1402)-2'-O)-methyltransferase [Pullulanibacillus sp. KACC 23026]